MRLLKKFGGGAKSAPPVEIRIILITWIQRQFTEQEKETLQYQELNGKRKQKLNTVDTHVAERKQTFFARTLRRKFNVSNLPSKKLSEADTEGGSHVTGAMSSEFFRSFKNS